MDTFTDKQEHFNSQLMPLSVFKTEFKDDQMNPDSNTPSGIGFTTNTIVKCEMKTEPMHMTDTIVKSEMRQKQCI